MRSGSNGNHALTLPGGGGRRSGRERGRFSRNRHELTREFSYELTREFRYITQNNEKYQKTKLTLTHHKDKPKPKTLNRKDKYALLAMAKQWMIDDKAAFEEGLESNAELLTGAFKQKCSR